MNPVLRIQLSALMFLQFFVWGSWYVTAPNYLGRVFAFLGTDFGWIYSAGPLAAIITPLFVGMLADRYFPVQRVLGVMHIAGAAIILLAIGLMGSSDPNHGWVIAILFLYMMTYYPTLALANTLCMRNMASPDKEFPLIRVLGTIGWIAAAFALSLGGLEKNIGMFWLVCGTSLVLGLFCFTLPHTPPSPIKEIVSVRRLLGMDALVLLKNRSYLTFVVASVLICIPLAFYYQLTSRFVEMGGMPVATTMSYGQMTEIAFMLVMPLFFARLGVKWMLGIGMLAWTTRYVLFAIGAPDAVVWMILGGILLHGICYDFFFVTGQLHTDRVAPRSIRGQAQGMLVLFTLGLGMFIGAQLCGQLEKRFTPAAAVASINAYNSGDLEHIEKTLIPGIYDGDGPEDWENYPEFVDAIDRRAQLAVKRSSSDETGGEARDSELELLDQEIDFLIEPLLESGLPGLQALLDREDRSWVGGHQETSDYLQSREARVADGTIEEHDREFLRAIFLEWVEHRGLLREYLHGIEWRKIWTVPAILAGVVMVLFLIFFRQPKEPEPSSSDD